MTINPYEKDVEVNVPDYKRVIKTFKKLSNYIGSNCLKWRYNLIFITEKYDLEFHIEKFSQTASELSDYTNYCTINFIDLYKKVVRNFPQAREVEIEEQLIIGENFSNIAADYDIQIKTCLEGTLLDQFGCDSSGCMTQKVIERSIGNNLKIPKGKYKSRECNCIFGRDIGTYYTCMHRCKYCYANSHEIIYYFSLTTDYNILFFSN